MKKYWENDGNANDEGDFVAVLDMENGTRPSRFVGKSLQDVADRMMDSYANAVAEMDNARRVARANLKPDAPSIALVDAKPKTLTPDQAFQAAADIADPATVQRGIATVIEAVTGIPPSKLASIIQPGQETAAQDYFRVEAEAFAAANPDYYPDPTNVELLFNLLEKRNMQPTRNNLTIAFDDLSSRGLLIQAPEGQPQPAAQPGNQQPEPITPAPGAQSARTVRPRYASSSTGLRSSDASATPPAPVQPKKVTRAEIDAMPKDVYAERLRTDRSFRQAVDALV